MSSKNKLLNCYQDLQRAAVSYYKNPQGTVHIMFIDHALKILGDVDDVKALIFKARINDLKRNLKRSKKGFMENMADEILTTGVLLRQAS